MYLKLLVFAFFSKGWKTFVNDFKAGKEFIYVPVTVCDYMGEGVSENEKMKALKKKEYKTVQEKYFTLSERKKFGFKIFLSMKKLRQKMISDDAPKWVRKLRQRDL